VWNAARQEDALACSQASKLSVDHRSQLAFNDVNRLVVLGVDMNRRPRVSVASVLEEAELPCGLFSGHQALHDDACKNELFAVDITHCRFLSTVVQVFQACTAKMGRDPMSAVDHRLKVYGIEKLRVADASIMPDVTSGNTMAPCVVIGERAADIIKAAHRV
jgi:choline dehydrogenase-like flavoprotein